MSKKVIAKKVLVIALSLAMIVSSITIGPSLKVVNAAKKASKAGKVTSISVSNLPAKTLTLKKGKSKVLKVSVKTSGKKVSKAYSFKSSNKKVVKVAKKGKNIKVTAMKKGKATITIKAKKGGKKTKIKVTVGTPVSKITISKTKATVGKGKTVKLTAKAAAPKNASNKKIVWKSSNTKVATVDAKGVVKGIKAGKAKITAVAADGSGKKKTCTVTVTDVNDIQSVKVLNEYSISVTLSKAQQLSVSNFTIKIKEYDKGSYNKVCKIDNISTNDKKTYYIVLDSDNTITVQNIVQVSVTGLAGVKGIKSAEVRYVKQKFTTQSEKVITATLNEKVNASISVSGYGYSKLVSATGLPAGIKAKMSDDGKSVYFSGKPTVKGQFNSVVTAQDELGNTIKYNIVFLVGSSDTIVAGTTIARAVIGTSGYSFGKAITVTGGSGKYTYEIIGENYGLSMNNNGYVVGIIKAAGTYKVTVKVTDSENATRTATAILIIELRQGYTVTGVVKDADGKALPYAIVEFDNTDKADLFTSYKSATADDKGAYSVIVPAGTYDVVATKSRTKKVLYSVNISGARSGLDIIIPVYKILVQSNNSTIEPSLFGTWYDEDDTSYGNGRTLYLKAGKHSLTTTINSGLNFVTAKLNITITKSQTVTAAVTVERIAPAGNITAGQILNAPINYAYKYYSFVPTETGNYTFYSLGNYDTVGALYDSNYKQLALNDDGGSGYNFSFTYYCEAGKTYYFAVKRSGEANVLIELHLEKAA